MSNNTGYIRTENLYRIENLDLIGTLTASGGQICINRTNNGPALQLGGNPSYTNDLFLVQQSNGEDIIRITNKGQVWLQDELLTNRMPAREEKGILFVQDEFYGADDDEFIWDYDQNFLGIGTNLPEEKLHLSDGNLLIDNGFLKFNGKITLNKDMCVLDAVSGETDDDQGLILGNPHKNGSWRVVVSKGNLIVQKRINGDWTTRGQFS